MRRADEQLGAEKHPDDASPDELREQIENNRELSDDELEQAAGGDDGWGGGTTPPPGGGG
ncbi:MAG TPA: hypothetical protein VN493_04825 [Thermoanaerobaculia bacterium]|nr:hypothetical protein [Thermoanaerobaculia bacterium]